MVEASEEDVAEVEIEAEAEAEVETEAQASAAVAVNHMRASSIVQEQEEIAEDVEYQATNLIN